MKTIINVLALSACMLMIGAPLAIADDVSDELAEMRAQVEQLKGQVAAQSEQIDHQGQVIRQARLEQAERSDSRFGASGITAFLQRLEVSGHVSGSWFWNFNNPGSVTSVGGPGLYGLLAGGNTGVSGNTYPYHGNHNSFQVDQVWFGIEHPVDEENRAGFRFDLLYGTTACWVGNAVPGRCGFPGILPGLPVAALFEDNTSQYYVSQAYIQYLAPITENGILIKAGKWATLVGAEVPEATANFNITRGNVYSILQPDDHVGVLASTDIGDTGFSAAFGVMNDDENGFVGVDLGGIFPGLSGSGDPDRNDAKSIAVQLGWEGETISVANTLLWGPSRVFSDNHASGLYDLLVTWDPTDEISAYVNVDFAWFKAPGGANQHAWGLSTAGRYAVTERIGISGRFEFVRDDGGFAGWVNTGLGPPFPSNSEIYSVTGTVDYALTTNLLLRGEIRYDNITKDFNDNEFFDKGGDFRPDQTTAGVELIYEF